MEEIEIGSLDLRYESCRMKNIAGEKQLLGSILAHGIREALQGVSVGEHRILLDGFKRYRCARRLGIGIVPYLSLGSVEAIAIVQLMRSANAQKLNILEQAKFIEELRSVHKMTIAEIANLVERSKSWVSMRCGILEQMSVCVQEQIFNGAFPAYAYMYILRRFIRMNCATKQDIDAFVLAVAGQALSIREIEFLAGGFFQGGEQLREQILRGNVAWGLKKLKESRLRACGSEFEQTMLRELQIAKKYLQRISFKSKDPRLQSNAFFAQASLLITGIEKQLKLFIKAIEDLNARATKA